jgi:uncharacterized protein
LGHRLKYRVVAERLAICRLAPENAVPDWALGDEILCVMRTRDELSIVCHEGRVALDHEGVLVERGWAALRLEGPFPFAMTGVLSSFIEPLAQAGIPIFAISTYDTDYVLIKQQNVEPALTALGMAGHEMLDAVP